MKRNKKKKILLAIIILVIIDLLLFAILFLNRKKTPTQIIKPTPTKQPAPVDFKWHQADWEKKHQINSDYIGTLRFESGIIDQDIVQGDTNEKYLRTNWQTMEYDAEGTCFLDASSAYKKSDLSLEDKNITIYGHYVYPYLNPDRSHKFTPLHLLKEKENYEKNKYVDLLLADEVRRYIVSDVFYVNLLYDEEEKAYLYTEKEMQYYLPAFESEYLTTYKEAIKNNIKKYETGLSSETSKIDISTDDQLLTLQTCVENRDDLRLIVICKEVGRYSIEK